MELSQLLSLLILFSNSISPSSSVYPGCYHADVTWQDEDLINSSPEPAGTAEECQAICVYFMDDGCSHFTWYSAENLCYLFKQPTTERECSSDCISATLECGNTCHAKETGGPTRNKVFKIAQGNKEQVYCEEISSPCYMKNSKYEEGWLSVDPNQNYVHDCYNNPKPDLKPLNETCGFEIRDVDDVHDGEWLCGNIEPDQSAIKVASKATVLVCGVTSCGSMVGWFDFSDFCGCFSFFGDESLSWSDARKRCQQYQGDLVTLDEVHKQDDIFQRWDTSDIWVNPWIGAHKDGSVWKWASNGGTIPEEESENPFSNWDFGQPDVGDCAYFSKAGYGTWASQDCKYEGPFICERLTLFPRDPCNLPESGSPSTDKTFIVQEGEAESIYCEGISTASDPCYVRNPGFNGGRWLTVDPSSQPEYVYDCDGVTPVPELKPLLDGRCGFEIPQVEGKHTGAWTCGTMRQDGAAREIVSTASLYAVKVVTDSRTWNDARRFCQDGGGDLLALDSYDKNYDILLYWEQLDIWVNPWIGAHKDGGVWKWVNNGETIPEEESDDPFSNWDWGQPEVGACSYMSKLGYGTWTSDDCKFKGPFICEY